MTNKKWLITVILTFITVCAWVIFDIIHARAQVEPSAEIKEVIDPINPQFNLGALESKP